MRFFLTVVVVEIDVRGIADRTNDQLRDGWGFTPALHRSKRFAVVDLELS